MRPLLIIGLLAAVSLASTAFAADVVPVRSITVSGMAERSVAPDEAHIDVTLEATNLKLADAKAAHDAKLKKLFAIAEKNGIPQKNLSTQSSSVQPSYSYSDNKRIFNGYRVQTSIDVKIDDIGKVGTLVEQIMASGLEEKNQEEYGQLLSTRYGIAKPDELRDALLADAIRNARAKAQHMAAAAEANLGRVYQVSEGEVPNFQPRPVMMMARAEAAAGFAAKDAVAPPPGEQELRSTVTVTFELID